MSHSSPESLDVAQQALKVASDALAAQASQVGQSSRVMQRPEYSSGEFQVLLLSLVNEIKTDNRDHRGKLESILVRLTEGDGRMVRLEEQGTDSCRRLVAIEERLVAVERDTNNSMRGIETKLQALERGATSGIQRAIRHAVTDAARTAPPQHAVRPNEGSIRISTQAALKIIGAIAAGCVTVIGGYFALRQPAPPTLAVPVISPLPPAPPELAQKHTP